VGAGRIRSKYVGNAVVSDEPLVFVGNGSTASGRNLSESIGAGQPTEQGAGGAEEGDWLDTR
jgi:hypothetical protein